MGALDSPDNTLSLDQSLGRSVSSSYTTDFVGKSNPSRNLSFWDYSVDRKRTAASYAEDIYNEE